MRSCWQKHPSRIANQKGFILLTTLLLMLVLATLVFVGTQWAQMDIGKTKKYTKTRDSFYIAEAGLQRAINFFNFDPATGDCPGEVENGFQDELDGTWPSSLSHTNYQGGEYRVTITNNNDGGGGTDLDNTVILNSVGTKRGVSTTIEATIYRPLLTTHQGIITEEKLTVDGGSLRVDGTNGLVHSNSDFEQNGSGEDITNGTTANNNCCTCNGDSCLSDQDIGKIDLPAPDVEFFRPYADFVLHDNGEIGINTKDSDGNIISTITLVEHSNNNWIRKSSVGNSTLEGIDEDNPDYDVWDNIDFSSDSWRVSSSDDFPNGIYFIEGSFAATGSSSTPWEVTIISTANIDLSGSREFENYISGPYEQVIKDAFLVADRDIEISGSVSVNTRGFIHTRDQIKLAGTVNLNGWIVAAGIYPSPSNGNPPPSAGGKGLVNENKISGNVHITYNDPIGSPNPACVVKVLSWREIG